MMSHVMLDLETLGTKPGCVIASIGACVFGPDGLGERFYQVINISIPLTPLTIDGATVNWWMQQSDKARDIFKPNSHHVSNFTAMRMFEAWWKKASGKFVWAAPAHFDIPILQAGLDAALVATPWDRRNILDAKTLYALTGITPDRTVGTAHNALDDAVSQAMAAIKALNMLGWPKE